MEAELEVVRLELAASEEERQMLSSTAKMLKKKWKTYRTLHRRARHDLEAVAAQYFDAHKYIGLYEALKSQDVKLREEVESLRETAVTASLLEADQKHKSKLVEALRIEVEELQLEGASMEADIKKLVEKCASLEKDNAELKLEMKKTQEHSSTTPDALVSLSEKCTALEKENTSLKEETEKLAVTMLQEKSDIKADGDARCSALEMEITILKAEMEDVVSKSAQMQQEDPVKLLQKCATLEKENLVLRAENKKRATALQQSNNEMKTRELANGDNSPQKILTSTTGSIKGDVETIDFSPTSDGQEDKQGSRMMIALFWIFFSALFIRYLVR